MVDHLSSSDRSTTRVIEGIITSWRSADEVHVAAMGPIVTMDRDGRWTTFRLRPYVTSQTLANLEQTGCGVFHLIDDSLQLARIITGEELRESSWHRWNERYAVLEHTVSWFAFDVESIGSDEPRRTVDCRVVRECHERSWTGWNRAAHAIVELAILFSRVGIMPTERLIAQVEQLEEPVLKTGGARELEAWKLITRRLQERIDAAQ